MDHAKASPSQVDWHADGYWRNRRLSPAQLQIFDVRLESWRTDVEPMLEMKEVLSSTLLPDLENRDRLSNTIPFEDATTNRNEQNQLRSLVAEYGWMNCLRSRGVQKSHDDPPELRKCRWIHISSKFSDNLQGVLLALSNWDKSPSSTITALHQLEHCIYQNERFSKHGRYFAPFHQDLDSLDQERDIDTPMFLSIPFLDWGVDGEPPPLRFQVDPREGYQSSRSTSHTLRSILQHYYRLEDTADRESMQAFTKHKPWQTDRSLDLKVRRWYGHYPSSLNVDELWILKIDSRHVVSFSSNQSWKSRWPPLQLSSRIMEVSFRGIRNSFLVSTEDQDYDANTHIIATLSGALGMLHRSFWTDITLCLSDRYASYLSQLQYRLHRSPSTKLVMDLLQVQEELNIVIQIMDGQIQLIKDMLGQNSTHKLNRRDTSETLMHPDRATYRQYSSSTLSDPVSQLLENMHREHVDLCDLRENSNALINRTIQLVNIRLEDHGKAILVFTIVTIIFLPLSFVSSFFGMNFADIRDMTQTQGLFWIISGSLTIGTVGLAIFLAFYGGAIVDWFVAWKENRRRRVRVTEPRIDNRHAAGLRNFEVLEVERHSRFGNRFS